MSRRFIIGAIAVLLTGIALATLLSWKEFTGAPAPSEKDIAKQYAEIAARLGQVKVQNQAVLVPIELSHPIRLAIGGLGLEDNDQNRELGDVVTVKLTGTPGFELVERQSLAKIIEELNLNWSGFVRAKDVVRAGKLLKVDWFLLGTKAGINGTNALVVRVVDARTGVMRDAGVFPMDKPPLQLAEDLAGFMRQSRENAASAKMRVYVAVGAFEDLSVNDRQADFPAQIRGYLTAAYRGSSVTLLEREYVETLVQEVHLDLAGLTEESESNSLPAMQSAFWVVSGEYQSYETTNQQVELNLDVARVFGTTWHRSLRNLPGEPIGEQVKASIDQVMNQNSGTLIATRASEARIQMETGIDVASAKPLALFGHGDFDLVGVYGNWNLDPQLAARQRRNLAEAMRAFQTVLLLEPTNRRAKMYLAACLRYPVIFRLNEACVCYREIIDDPTKDKWSGLARQALVQTLLYSNAQEKLRWLEAAAAQTTNAVAVAFYNEQAQAAGKEVAINSGNTPEAAKLAEQRLYESIQSFKNFLTSKSGTYRDDMGLDDYIAFFSWDHATAALKTAELLPELEKQSPDLEPYLLATVLTYQETTNTPLTEEFQQVLNNSIEHPQQVLAPLYFWDKIRWSVYDWSFEKTNYSLAVNLMEGERCLAASNLVDSLDFDDDEKLKLAYAYLAAQRPQDALNIFDSFANRPVRTRGSGPWGRAFEVVMTDKMAAFCRRQLGLAAPQNSHKFDMGKPVLCLCSPSTFVTDADGLWVGIDGRLLHLDFDLRTNLDVKLPVDDGVPMTALCLTPSKVWIGTRGAGLIEFDRSSARCRRLTETDGLMMNNLASLEANGDSLWVGYGGSTGGGLGVLDLRSQKLTSFMPSLNPSSHPRTGEDPPRDEIKNIVAGEAGDLLVSVGSVIRQFHPARNAWETLPRVSVEWVSCFSADSGHLVEGGGINQLEIEISSKPTRASPTNQVTRTRLNVSNEEEHRIVESFKTNKVYQWISLYSSGNIKPKGKIAIQNLRDDHWEVVQDPDGIPNPPTTMTLDGNDLWVGSEGAIALVDLNSCKVKKFCHIAAASVDRIQIAGGYVWAQFDWHLYRVPLNSVE